MSLLAAFFAFAVVFWFVSSRMAAGAGGLGGGRVLAHGLVLSASSLASGERRVGLQRFELRDLVLDVEIPGQAPYEVAVTPLIPRFCEGRPGARFDLAVNPKRPNDIVILGPSGSSAWLKAAPLLTGGTASANGGRFVAAGMAGFFAMIFAGAFVSGLTKGAQHEAAPATTHAAAAAAGARKACDMAARCCKVLGHSSCTQFATMNEVACGKTLADEMAAASKAHKVCQ